MTPRKHTVSTLFLIAVAAALLTPAVAAPAAAATYPKTDPAHAFAALKVYDAAGSPLRRPVEDWDGARRRVANDPAWQKWLAAQRADTDDWMQRRRDHIEWIAGWYHDFVSPRDGSHLIWTPDEPGEDTLHSPSDPHVKLTPKLRAAWVFAFRGSHAQHMVNAAMLYRATGDTKYADWTAGQLDFYADNFARWPAQSDKPGTHLMWQSLDEAVDLVKYANTARILEDHVTPAHKQRWFTEFFQPECDLLNKTMHSIHNIACWHRAAVGCVAVYYNDAALWKAAVEAPFGIRDQMARGVTSDYLWQEQSLGYNSYVIKALLPFFEDVALSGDAAKLRPEMEIAENLMLAPISIRFPTGQLPNPADGGPPGKAPDTGLLAAAARVFPTSIGIAAQAKRLDWEALMDPVPALPTAATAALPPLTSHNMVSSRMAILKQGAWQMYLHYGQLTHSHAQAEALNYEAFYDRTDITHDPGTVGYGSPLHRDFYSTGLAHNVPLIDGQGQEGWSPGELLSFRADAPARVVASQPKYRANASAQRDITIDGTSLTDTLTLATADGQSHELGLLLQLQGQAKLPASFQPDTSFKDAKRPLGFAYWIGVTSARFTDTATFTLSYPGGRIMQIAFSVPGTFTVTHASTPDAPPHRRETFFLRTTGKNAVFKTVWSPG